MEEKLNRKRMLRKVKQRIKLNNVDVDLPVRHREFTHVDDNLNGDDFCENKDSKARQRRRLKQKISKHVRAQDNLQCLDDRARRGADNEGKIWFDIPNGTLVYFLNDKKVNNLNIKKGTFAIVVATDETLGKKYVNVLVDGKVVMVSKGCIKSV